MVVQESLVWSTVHSKDRSNDTTDMITLTRNIEVDGTIELIFKDTAKVKWIRMVN